MPLHASFEASASPLPARETFVMRDSGMLNSSRMSQNQHFRQSMDSYISELESDNVDNIRIAALESIRRKLRSSGISAESIVESCKELDRNGDGIIHPDDFLDILNDLLPPQTLSRRELRHLRTSLTEGKAFTALHYRRLPDILAFENSKTRREVSEERWIDEGKVADSESWATRSGSLGEWLYKAACPAEQKNFVRFIRCLEKFERESGMKIVTHNDGFVVPLGPDLRASINIYMA